MTGRPTSCAALHAAAATSDRHAQHAWLAYFGRIEHATRHEQLYDIGTARIQIAHLFGGLGRTAGNLGEQARAVAIRAP